MKIQKSDKTLITGGCGFIGSNFLKNLNKSGHDNIVLCDFLNEKNIKNIIGARFLDIISPNDIFNKINLKEFGLIIHMGADSSTSCTFENAINLNYNFSKRLFEESSGRFVYASSASIYGNDICSDNDDDFFNYYPKSNYSISKYLFDQYLITNNWFDFRPVLGCRIFNAFGQGEGAKGDMASYVFNSFKKALDGDNELVVYTVNNLIASRDFIYIEDIIKKINLLIDNKCSGIYNIGNGYAMSWKEYAKIISAKLSELFGRDFKIKEVEVQPSSINEFYQTFTKSDNQKINKELNLTNSTTYDRLKGQIENYLEYLFEEYGKK